MYLVNNKYIFSKQYNIYLVNNKYIFNKQYSMYLVKNKYIFSKQYNIYLVNSTNIQLYKCILLGYSRYNCYIKMHEMESFTIVNAQEARSISNYKNTKYKLLKTSAEYGTVRHAGTVN